MRRTKVIQAEEVHKEQARILGRLNDRICGIVRGALSGVKQTVQEELDQIALLVIKGAMEIELTEVAGVKGKHDRGTLYGWWGRNPGSVVVDGKKVYCEVPRGIHRETGAAYRLKTNPLFRQAGELVTRAYRDLIRGVSTRQYAEGVTAFLSGHGVSASTVSRRMVVATSRKVEELMTRSLADLELLVLMIDGVHVGDQTVVVALGIDTRGVKHILGLRQGASETTQVTKALCEDLIERGLSTDRPLLVVIDGAKALRRAVADVFGRETLVQRCTVHKKRNVLEHVSRKDRLWVSHTMTRAYGLMKAEDARRELLLLRDKLQKINPDAARSLEEGLEETLTLHHLNIPEALRRSLRSTNIIESAINGTRTRSRNVKRWYDGDHVERWTSAGLLESEKQFRRIRGYQHLPILIAALNNWKKHNQEAA